MVHCVQDFTLNLTTPRLLIPYFDNLTFGVIICDDRVGGHKLNFQNTV